MESNVFPRWKFPGESLALVSAQSFALNAPRNECPGCMQRRDLSGRPRADKLDPSIIGEDLLHRRGGAQKAAILGACDRCSFPGRANRRDRHSLATKTDLQQQTNCLVISRSYTVVAIFSRGTWNVTGIGSNFTRL